MYFATNTNTSNPINWRVVRFQNLIIENKFLFFFWNYTKIVFGKCFFYALLKYRNSVDFCFYDFDQIIKKGRMGSKYVMHHNCFTFSIPIVSFLLNRILKIRFSDVTSWKLYSLSSACVFPAVSTVAKILFLMTFLPSQKICDIYHFPIYITYPYYVFSDLWT